LQGIDIVVAGDSMMRQHFTRLVQLLRGRQRNVDYRVHTHGSYSYCDEVCSISLAKSHCETVAHRNIYICLVSLLLTGCHTLGLGKTESLIKSNLSQEPSRPCMLRAYPAPIPARGARAQQFLT